MGHRANLVIANEHGYRLFYCHWCAITLSEPLFWGPEHAIAFIEQQQPCAPDQWLDDVWAEGGAVVDTARRVLIIYGGEGLRYTIPLRRLYLELLRRTWQGWAVRWAERGIVDMAEHVGVPRAKVLVPEDYTDVSSELRTVELRDAGCVISARFEDGSLRIYSAANNANEYLAAGEHVVDWLRADPGQPALAWDDPGAELPYGGLHFDIPTRQIAFWSPLELERLDDILASWPGWQIRWLGDRYEEHAALTDGRLRLVPPPEAQLIDELEKILLRENAFDGAQMILNMAAQHQSEGKQIQINPHALRDKPLPLPTSLRRQLFADAVAARGREQPSPNGCGGIE